MSLPEQLRAIAVRIENADDARRAALVELRALLDGSRIAADSASVPVADEGSAEAAPVVASASAPVEEPARLGLSPMLHCPECGRELHMKGYWPHRARVHGMRKPPPTAAEAKAAHQKGPTNGRGAAPPLIGRASVPDVPVIRKGEEWFLCSRCPEQFRTAEALKGHMQKGHPPAAAPPTRPFGEPATVEFARGLVE